MAVNREDKFYTVRGYALLEQEGKNLTPSMEDYLEMAYRLAGEQGFTRISDLAATLNVQPPSASKMVSKLAAMGYLNFEKYGLIEFTQEGSAIGKYLLKRHEIIERFLSLIGIGENRLEQTEKIEHNISESTLQRIGFLLAYFEENPHILENFKGELKKRFSC